MKKFNSHFQTNKFLKMKNNNTPKLNFAKHILILLSIFIVSCENDDNDLVSVVANNVNAPSTYAFTRDGINTVSFGGQSTRLAQSNELYAA